MADVPGDGNCLIWTLKQLFFGVKTAQLIPSQAERIVCHHMRLELKKAWNLCSTELYWQQLFSELIEKDLPPSTPQKKVKKLKSEKPVVDLLTPPRSDSDHKDSAATGSAIKIEKGLSTPPQKKANVEAVDLLTPPRPDQPATQPAATQPAAKAKNKPASKAKAAPVVPRLGNARPANGPHPEEPGTLRAPCFKRSVSPSSPPPQAKRRRMNPEQQAEQAMVESEPVRGEEPPNPPPKRFRLDGSICKQVDAADWAEEMLVAPLLEDPEDEELKTDTSNARHRVQKRVKTERQLEEDALRSYLAEKGVQYGVWLQHHRKHCAIPKAGLCQHGGFVRFQAMLRTGDNKIECKACLEIVDTYDISLVEAQQLLCGAPLPIEDIKKRQEDGEDEVAVYDEVKELAMAKDLIRSMAPVIELVENDTTKGYKLAFRCLACCTRGQPEGKLNTLVRPRLNAVRHFLSQHLKTPTHSSNAREYLLELEAAKKEKPDCPALCVNECGQSLALIQEEYRLWATHTMLNTKTGEHKYWTELSTNKWFVRHKGCKGKIDSCKLPCCKLCHSLGEPRGIKRYVTRFMFKMHSANLLCHNLFMGPEAADEYKKKVLNTEFGKRHNEHLNKIFKLNMPELQKLVRGGFTSVPGERMTSAMRSFTAITVVPCLRVHVGSLDPKLPDFVSHFLTTLQSRNMSEMSKINMAIATAAATGKLESNPVMQGILVKCIRTLDREERGVHSTRGRYGHGEVERNLINDAALTMCLSGAGNKQLAAKLGQNSSPPRIFLDDLIPRSLPCPALALLNGDDLATNLELVDQRYPRSQGEPARRLIVAVDHTYLQRSLQQVMLRGRAGLVGGCWWPSDPSSAFLDFEELPENPLKTPKAPLMLEMLAWDPNATKKECYSLASMPMSLAPKVEQEKNRGNHVSWMIWGCERESPTISQ